MVLYHLRDGIKKVFLRQVVQPIFIDIDEVMPYSPINFAGIKTHNICRCGLRMKYGYRMWLKMYVNMWGFLGPRQEIWVFFVLTLVLD